MKNYGKIIFVIGIVLTVFACSRNQKEIKDQSATAGDFKSESSNLLSSSAAVEKDKNAGRKFIRTADIKFRVVDVVKSTYEIENVVSEAGGFVSNTNLKSDIDNKTNIQVSQDSSVETTYYTIQNTMTFRVPNTKLDSTLKSISGLVDYMDYRIIKADDASLLLMKNDLYQKSIYSSDARMKNAIDKHGKKLNETIDAEENISGREANSNDLAVSNLSLLDKVNFSTVSLNIYQKQTAKSVMLAINKNVKPYEPGFGEQIVASLNFGLDILKNVLVFLARLWALIFLGILIFIGYRILKRKPLNSL